MTDEPIRVCFLLDELAVAGIEGQILLLLRYLNRAKVQPYLCLLRGQDPISRQMLEVDGRPVLRLGVGALRHFSTFRKGMQFARFLRRERIDVLHPLLPDSLYFGAPMARLAGVPCVVRFRVDLNFWMKPRDRWLGKMLTRWVDATVANCEACRNVVVEHERASPQSIAIIPNGLELSRFQDFPPLNCADPLTGCRRVGAVANLRQVKNLGMLVRAAAIVLSSNPNVHFQIAGEGECRKDLESLICELGLQGRFELLGAVADVPGFLRTLNVAVLCSSSEGSPNAIMEYMAAGLPTVTADVGGCRELIEHERHGLLVAPGDVQQLAASIVRLLHDRDLATRLGANARQRAFAEYGVDRQARRYEDFYRDLLLKKNTRGRTVAIDTSHTSANTQSAAAVLSR